MTSRHECEKVRHLLDAFVVEDLAQDQCEIVQTHLKHCEACSRRVFLLRGLASAIHELDRKDEAQHIASDLIVDIALEPASVPPAKRSQALEHIATCTRCRDEYRLAQKAGHELGLICPGETPSTWFEKFHNAVEKILGRGPIPVVTAGLAALALLLLFLLSGHEGMKTRGLPHPVTVAPHGKTATAEYKVHHLGDWFVLLKQSEREAKAGDTTFARVLLDSAWILAFRDFGAPESSLSLPLLYRWPLQFIDPSDYGRAESLFVYTVRIRSALLGSDSPQLAIHWEVLGRLYDLQLRHRESVEFYKRAVALSEKAPLDSARIAFVRRLAGCLHHLGRYSESQEVLLTAAALSEKFYRRHITESASAAYILAMVYDNLGHNSFDLGRYGEAEGYYHEALEIRKRAKELVPPQDLGASISYFGRIYNALGRYDKAASCFRQAIELRRKGLGDCHPDVASSQINLAWVYEAQGNYAKAESLFKAVLDTRLKTLAPVTPGGAHPGIASSYSSLAAIYTEEGRYSEAEPLYRKAIEIWRKAYGGEHPRSVFTLHDLAYNYEKSGRYGLAESTYACARDVAERTLGEDHPDLAMVLESMSRLLGLERRYGEAAGLAKRALAIQYANFITNAEVLSEMDALSYFGMLAHSLDSYLSCLADASLLEDGDWELGGIILSSKGTILGELFERQRMVFENADSTTKSIAATLRDVRFQLSELRMMGPGHDVSKYQVGVDSLEHLAENLESMLARHSASFRQRQSERQKTWEDMARDVVANLPRDAALVEYERWNYIDPQTERLTPRYLAMVLRKDASPEFVALGDAKPIDDVVATYQAHMERIAKSGRGVGIGDEIEYEEIASRLYNLIWLPIENLIPEGDLTFIVPDGALNLVSFVTLKRPDGKYLIESRRIHYLTTGRDVARLRREDGRNHGLLVMADPAWKPSQGIAEEEGGREVEVPLVASLTLRGPLLPEEYLKGIQFEPLPWARKETELIVSQWRTVSDEPVRAYLGEQATEQRFRVEAPRSRIIHLATHGFFLEESSRRSSQGLMTFRERTLPHINPLLLSGLLLAESQEDTTGSSAGEDGVLTALEVSTMDLSGVDLVVLSACETGLGTVAQGEGIYGLRRAFEEAGVRTIVSALWAVPDEPTARIMSHMYLRGDETVVDRLRNAQLEMIADLRKSNRPDHPYFWGGFIAAGSWH